MKSSPAKNQRMLTTLRYEMDLINNEIIEKLMKREEIAARILNFKENKDLSIWDPAREIHVFKSALIILGHENLELMSVFSFIMEKQARKFNPDYPRWSQGDHLVHPEDRPFHQINPVLLMLVNKGEYLSLKINLKMILEKSWN